MSEVTETSIPETVRNHWWCRSRHAEGRHFWACHLILDDQPELGQLAADYQQALIGLDGIDLIPAQWLHLTMQGIAFTDEVPADELGHLDHALTAALAAVEPPAVEFRALTIQGEAVYLKAHPRRRAHPATSRSTRRRTARPRLQAVRRDPGRRGELVPHVSIGYITYNVDPQPIAAALSSLTT